MVFLTYRCLLWCLFYRRKAFFYSLGLNIICRNVFRLSCSSCFFPRNRLFSKEMGKIGTHNGKFHCDEAFACFMLNSLNDFKDYDVVRSRDPKVLDECDVVVDVGGIFNHDNKRYDHHQRGFTENMMSLKILDFSTKLSSAGLVYAYYGKKLIAQLLNVSESDDCIPIFYRKLYECFVEQIDAVDNGIPQYDGVPRYLSSGGISGRVGHLNPDWNEEGVEPDERFAQAMALVGEEFVRNVKYLHGVWWPARQIVEEAVNKRKEIDPSGRIVLMENGGVPWKEHFFDLEEQKGILGEKMTYMLFGDSTAQSWRVQAIPTDRKASFENRGPLPKAWRGLRDDDLSKESGIEGCVFVHISGFIGGHKTREGAIEMAKRALPIVDKEQERRLVVRRAARGLPEHSDVNTEEEIAAKKLKLAEGDVAA